MKSFQCEVPFLPVAKGRPRVTTRAGHAQTYTPKKTTEAEDAIRLYLRMRLPANWEPFTGPVRLVVVAMLPGPKTLKPQDRLSKLPTTRPDVDNYGKLMMDACDDLWVDDSQVTTLVAMKRYTTTEERGFWVVRVSDDGWEAPT